MYKSKLDIKQTQKAIKLAKDTFEKKLIKILIAKVINWYFFVYEQHS